MFNIGTKKKTFNVEGMTCHHCEMTVEKALSEILNVKSVKADHLNKIVEVKYKGELDIDQMKERVEKAGYRFVSAN